MDALKPGFKFLITGCGRSGTNYVADRLGAAGILCGHENVFTVNGPVDSGAYVGDSSWFAAPYLDRIDRGIRVVHVVRDPRLVVNSFHRIGLCADSLFRHFAMGRTPMQCLIKYNINLPRALRRYNYVRAHRRMLADNSTCMEAPSEFKRLCEYWYQWNKLVESQAKEFSLPYLRVRLEDIDSRWDLIAEHIGVAEKITGGKAVNKKLRYGALAAIEEELPAHVKSLAVEYGY